MTLDMSAARTGSEPGEPQNNHPEAKGQQKSSTRASEGEGTFSTIRHRADGATAPAPTPISDAQKGRLFHARNVIGDAQRLAKAHLDDPQFDWRKFGQLVGNFLMILPAGRYVYAGAKRPMPWPVLSPAVALCFGCHRVFDTVDLAPGWVVAEVAAGIADAQARQGHIRYVAEDCGRKLKATAAEILALGLWRFAPIDCTAEEWLIIKDEREKQNRTAKRRAKGARPRAEYEAASIAAEARRLGIKPDTLLKRRRRAQAKDVRCVVDRKSPIANDTTSDTPRAAQPVNAATPTLGARPQARPHKAPPFVMRLRKELQAAMPEGWIALLRLPRNTGRPPATPPRGAFL